MPVFDAEDLLFGTDSLFEVELLALADLPPLPATLPAASTAPLIAPTAAPPAAPTTTSPITALALARTPPSEDDFLADVFEADVFFAEAPGLEVVALFAGVAGLEAEVLEVADLFAVSVFLAVDDFFESAPPADLEAFDLPPAAEEVLTVAAFLLEAVDLAESFLSVVVAIVFSLKVFFTAYARTFTLIIEMCQENFY